MPALMRRALLACLALTFIVGHAQAQYRGDFTSIDITKGDITCRGGASCDASTLRVKPGTGAGTVSRPLSAILANEVYAADYGVVPDDGIDDGPALREAIRKAQLLKAELRLPPGILDLCADPSDAEALVRIAAPMSLRGTRRTIIRPCADVGTRVVVLIKPPSNAGIMRGMAFRDFSIGVLGATRSGGDAIRVDTTTPNGILAKPLFENIGVADAGEGFYAFRHLHDPAANVTGGMFGATIRNSDLFGGLKFFKTGDSNNIIENVISGSNIGIDYEAISGAALHRIIGNNITSRGGAIRVKGTSQVKIIQNQTEQSSPYTGTEGAMIVLDGVTDWIVADNNLNAYDRVDCLLVKGGTVFGTMEANSAIYADNHFLYRAIGSQQNTLGRQRKDQKIAGIAYDANGGYVSGTVTNRNRPLTSLDTASEPTYGIYQKLALQNGWVDGAAAAFYQGLFVTRTPDGTLRFRGVTTAGTLTAGTTIAQLPGALYPEKAIVVAGKLSGTPWSLAIFQILPSGQIQALSVPAAGSVYWDDVSATRN